MTAADRGPTSSRRRRATASLVLSGFPSFFRPLGDRRRTWGDRRRDTNDLTGGRLVGNHLADLGHREIAIIAGQPYATTGIDRTAGCLAALGERGIEVPTDRIVHSRFDAPSGHEVALELMRSANPPTAIFAVNDITAIGAMGALRDCGLTGGRDVAVVGFNDISIAADLPTPLSTVRSLLHEMGRQAAGLSYWSASKAAPRELSKARS